MRAGAATAVISPLSQHLEEGVYLGGYGGYGLMMNPDRIESGVAMVTYGCADGLGGQMIDVHVVEPERYRPIIEVTGPQTVTAGTHTFEVRYDDYGGYDVRWGTGQWFMNGEPIPGATGMSVTVTVDEPFSIGHEVSVTYVDGMWGREYTETLSDCLGYPLLRCYAVTAPKFVEVNDDNDNAAAAFSAQANVNLTGITEQSDAGTTQGNGGGFAWSGM